MICPGAKQLAPGGDSESFYCQEAMAVLKETYTHGETRSLSKALHPLAASKIG